MYVFSLNNLGIPIVEIRQLYIHLISMIEISVLV